MYNNQVLVGIDGGNGHVKFCKTGGLPESIPSVTYFPGDRERYDKTTKSRKVEYISGPAQLQNQTWIVGEWAALMGGEPTFKVVNKATAQTRLALACIPPGTPQIKRLSLCLPTNDYLEQGDKIAPLLVGTHTYKLNGEKVTVKIDSVETLIEGEHAFRYLAAIKHFPYPQLVNGIIDVGTGNCTAMLYRNGTPLMNTRWGDGEGMVEIARSLQTLPVLDHVEAGGLSAHPNRILEGVRDKSFIYGNTGVSFKEGFDDYVYGNSSKGQPGWLRVTFNAIKRQWIDYMSEKTFADIAIIGGGAWLMQPLTIPKKKGQRVAKIAEDSQFVTVRGMCI